MNRPTRQEQAEAILARKGPQLANTILGRRATNTDDFAAAFNVERIDLIAAIPDHSALLALGRNVAGPRDGLYVMANDDGTYRVYVQERGIVQRPVDQADFDTARSIAIDRVIHLQGLPYDPPG